MSEFFQSVFRMRGAGSSVSWRQLKQHLSASPAPSRFAVNPLNSPNQDAELHGRLKNKFGKKLRELQDFPSDAAF